MDKTEFKERWEAIFNSSPNGCQLFAKLFYKKPLETNETRLERHRKQQVISQKKHHQEYKEYRKEYQKKRYQEYKEKRKEYRRNYYQEHKEQRKEYQRKYRQEHKKANKKVI